MLTSHQDNSQCPRFRVRPGCDTLWGLHGDHSPSCRHCHASLPKAIAARTVDSQTIAQVIRDQCLSRVSLDIKCSELSQASAIARSFHQEDKLMTLLLHIVMYKQDTIFAYNT